MNTLDLARFILGAWFTFLGAAIGSFANVVIYRLPAGLNIAWPGSHCPHCKHAIRWYDNLPVLGWLILRGKCRDCGATISIRYPIVEALTAGMFWLLAWCEFLRDQSAGLVFGPSDVRGPYVLLMAGCLLHCGLAATLLVAAATAIDGKIVSWKIFAPLLVAALLMPLFWSIAGERPLLGLVDVAEGLAAALIVSGLGYLIAGRKRAERSGFAGSCLCVGAVLGWQAIVVVGPLSVAVQVLLDKVVTKQPDTAEATRGGRWTIAALLAATLAWMIVMTTQ